jgi:hypothetical protein
LGAVAQPAPSFKKLEMSQRSIEEELELELAAIGSVEASYGIAGLGGEHRSRNDTDSEEWNPLSSLDGFAQFAGAVQEADAAKDRAMSILVDAKSILENNRGSCETGDASSSNDKDDEHSVEQCDESGGCGNCSSSSSSSTIVGSAATTPAHDEPPTAGDVEPPSATSNSTLGRPRVYDAGSALATVPLSPPTIIQLPCLSDEYDDELRAIEQEAREAEISRQERFRRAQALRDTALAEEKKLFESRTAAAIILQATARRSIGRQRVAQMRRGLQLKAHLKSVCNHVIARRAILTMQSHSCRLRRETFQTARARLHLHLLDCRRRYNAAATLLQSCFRRYVALCSLTKVLEAAHVLQSFLRSTQIKRTFRRLRASAIIVQRHARARAEKKAMARKIECSSTCIQRSARGLVARQRYQSARKSVITLQRCYRGQRARRQLKAIQQSSFAFDDDASDGIGELINSIGELSEEPDDAFLAGRLPPRRRELMPTVQPPPCLPSSPEGATAGSNDGSTDASASSTPPASNTGKAGGWGARVAQTFSQRGQNMLRKGRRRNNNQSRREGQSRWR